MSNLREVIELANALDREGFYAKADQATSRAMTIVAQGNSESLWALVRRSAMQLARRYVNNHAPNRIVAVNGLYALPAPGQWTQGWQQLQRGISVRAKGEPENVAGTNWVKVQQVNPDTLVNQGNPVWVDASGLQQYQMPAEKLEQRAQRLAQQYLQQGQGTSESQPSTPQGPQPGAPGGQAVPQMSTPGALTT